MFAATQPNGAEAMRILIKRDVDRDSRWQALSSLDYGDEDELQELLDKGSAELVPVDPAVGDVHVVFAREVATGSGPIDLVGVGSSGSITIMECKLAKNHQIKREVVGQVLDYAAALWETDPTGFAEAFAQKAGSDPFEALRGRFSTDGKPWDEEACRSEVARRLREGDFRLLIAVDSIDSELRRIIKFVNTRGSGASHLQLVALAFPRFAEGTTHVIVPETYGDEIAPVAPTAERREWTESDVLEYFRGRGDILKIATDFREWAESRNYPIVFTGDRRSGRIALPVGGPGEERQVFCVGDMIGVEFGWLRKISPFNERVNREDLVARIGTAFGRELPLTRSETSAYFPVEQLADPAVRERFEAVIDDAMARIAAARVATVGG